MKIRIDFVTNSSSSSFIAFTIKNKELAEMCKKFNVPVDVNKSTVNGYMSIEEGCYSVDIPNGGSIAEWFAAVIGLDNTTVYQLDGFNSKKAIEYIKSHINSIDNSTESAVLNSGKIVSDGNGSYCNFEIRENGVIKTAEVSDLDWGFDVEKGPLWSVLQYGDKDAVMEFAEDMEMFKEKSDPWINNKSVPEKKSVEKEQRNSDDTINNEEFQRELKSFKRKKRDWFSALSEKNWIERYGDLFDWPDFIALNEKRIVISGWHPVYDLLESFGAKVEHSYSDKSDYIFAEPSNAGEGKAQKIRDYRKNNNEKEILFVRADHIYKLIKTGNYSSVQTEREAKEKRRRETKDRLNKEIESNKDAYGVHIILMTLLKYAPEELFTIQDRIRLEALLISEEMGELLGTELKSFLDVYDYEAEKMLMDCVDYVKSSCDNSKTEEILTSLHERFSKQNGKIDTLIDLVFNTIKEA